MRLALAQLLQRMVGDIGFQQRIRGQDQHACHIHRDVADHDGPLTGEVDGQIAIVRVPIIPANKRGGRKGIGQIFTRDAHPSISLGANRIDDLIVELLELLMMDINTIGDVPEETDAWIRKDFIKDADHRLDGLVIGCNTVTDQSERGGEAIEQINGQDKIALLLEAFRRHKIKLGRRQ